MTRSVLRTATFDIEAHGDIGDSYSMECTALTIRTTDGNKVYYFTGGEDDIREGCEILLTYPRLCSFNGKGFDLKVLAKYFPKNTYQKVRNTPHYDLYQEWLRRYRSRMSLENLSHATLGADRGKFTLDVSPTALWKADPPKFRAYNEWDCYVTHLLFLHVIVNGYVLANLGKAKRKFYPESLSRIG